VANEHEVTADVLAIMQLKYRYCSSCDLLDLDGICSVFSDDAVLELGHWGQRVGMSAIREGFRPGVEKPRSAGVHIVSNPIIEVTGDEARGTWILTRLCFDPSPDATPGTPQSPIEIIARYHDRYRRVENEWKTSYMEIEYLWQRNQGRITPENTPRKIK
jgi:hypothetical protein